MRFIRFKVNKSIFTNQKSNSSMSKQIGVPEEVVMSKIYEVRGEKVMIDRDLAELYGVETKRLKEAVRRNISRFPEDFMFEMDKEEFKHWRTQNATSKSDQMGLRYAPFCFTEQGVTMLSCVLNSEQAIAVNIAIVRTFTKMRKMLLTHKDLLLQMEEIRKKVTGQDEKIELIFNYLKQFIKSNEIPRTSIGYKTKND
jgi:phage regulator Rha-like protein